MKRSVYFYLPAALTLALMAGLGIESLARPKPRDAEPFHAFVRGVAARLPMDFGNWRGKDQPPTPGAVKLLRPNVMIQRRFDNRTTGEQAGFLIVQCKDAREFGGHYPPNCYPAQGYTLDKQIDREWKIAGRTISGREYIFLMTDGLRTRTLHVYSLLLLPEGRLVRDIREVRAAAADFLRQFYGASQIQVVIDESQMPVGMADTLPADARDRVFSEIIEANIPIVDALISGGSR